MSVQKFEVEKSSEYKMKDGTIKFASKLVAKSVDDLLGLESQQTLYLHGNKALSGSIELDPDQYVIQNRDFTIPDGENAGEIISLKTIVAKRA